MRVMRGSVFIIFDLSARVEGVVENCRRHCGCWRRRVRRGEVRRLVSREEWRGGMVRAVMRLAGRWKRWSWSVREVVIEATERARKLLQGLQIR